MGNCCCSLCKKPPLDTRDPTPEPSTSKEPSVIQTKPKIVVGIHKFTAIDPQDLSFNKGDRLKIIGQTEEQWILVEHLSTRGIGYVPANHVALELTLESYDWYFGHISRKEAEILILGDENQPAGTFLIRVSESDMGVSLSVKDIDQERGCHVKHYKIRRIRGGRYCLSPSHPFMSIPDLVSKYSTTSIPQDRLLVNPCRKPEPIIADLSSNYRDKWEIDRQEINIFKQLGAGNFGEVYHGIWKGHCHVAIKTLKENSTSSKVEFLKEAAIMKTFRHKKLVRSKKNLIKENLTQEVQLYGVCTLEEPIYIIQEYMEMGNLQKYLREDQGNTVTFKDLIFIAFQVATGMEHLELINYVHRDLAARNVLLGPDKLAKICDFGLARVRNKHGYCIERGELPIKWTAPEALRESLFTIKSDVWSYGILLMELFTYGETPYRGMPSGVVADLIEHGYRMPKPKDHQLPDTIYKNIMLHCWQENPKKRPTFKYLAMYFENIDITYKMCGNGKCQIKIIHNVRNSYEDHLVF